MVLGVGLDLVEVEAVQASVDSHGERYLQRVFTPSERAACGTDPGRLAECFAVKEAVLKALGRRDEPVPWADIELDRSGDAATVRLRGAAARLAAARGVGRLDLSLSLQGRQAAALVLAHRPDRTSSP